MRVALQDPRGSGGRGDGDGTGGDRGVAHHDSGGRGDVHRGEAQRGDRQFGHPDDLPGGGGAGGGHLADGDVVIVRRGTGDRLGGITVGRHARVVRQDRDGG